MKRYTVFFLVVVNLLLMALLAWLWVQPDGQWRNVHWQAPEPKKVDFEHLLPPPANRAQFENSRLVALLDRPLFSLTRRPPPPPPPPPPPAPVDTLANAKLLALYGGVGTGGAVVQVGGRNRRVRLNEVVEGWVLTAIQGRSATFSNSGQTRVLPLSRATLTSGAGAPPLNAPAVPAASDGNAAPPPAGPSRPRGAVFGGS